MNRGVCAGRWVVVGGGGDSSSVGSGYLTNICTRPTPHLPSRSLHSDWLNWIKMTPIIGSSWGPAHRPNDPYLTLLLRLCPFLPHSPPFGTVYLGSITSISAQSPAEHNSPLTSWERRKGYIFCRCLRKYQRSEFLWSLNSSLFCAATLREKHRESRWGVLVWNVPIWYQYPWP